MSTHATQQPDHHINSSQTNLVLIKCFMHEVLQMALCYLEAIHSKVPDLVQKEKMGEGVQGELDLLGKIVQGDLNAEEWRELSLDLVIAHFIHMDAAVDIDSTKVDTMATMKVADCDDTPQSASLFTSQISSSNLDFTLNRLKLHLVQNLVKKVKVLSGHLPPPVTLPSPILCPRHTFLVSLILTLQFMQDWC